MPRLRFVRHHTVNQVRAGYRGRRHPAEKTRGHPVWLLAPADEPRTPAQVAAVVGPAGVTPARSCAGGTTTARPGWPTAGGWFAAGAGGWPGTH